MHTTAYDKTVHRRFNLLTGEWILVSPHRTDRPWQGQTEPDDAQQPPAYDPSCYLCPGNTRAGGHVNPDYSGPFVFTNDFAALTPEATSHDQTHENQMLRAEPETGTCRVICYSPRHDLTLGQMQESAVTSIISTWQHQYRVLGSRPDINHVQIFENRGQAMGCSNQHPHGQIWANRTVPDLPQREGNRQARYHETKQRCLLCTYLQAETEAGSRILFQNPHFVALVPFWAVWPFEVMILPRRHSTSINDLSDAEIAGLAGLVRQLNICYDNLFTTIFPYSMGIHQQPTDGNKHPGWHWHIHYYPPLLRSATIKKHMVGYEMLAMAQRDLTAEHCAALLRSVAADRHYLDQGAGP